MKVEAEERPTRSFYQRFIARHAQHLINEIHITPDWNHPDTKDGTTTTLNGILDEQTNYYSHLYRHRPSTRADRLLYYLTKRTFTPRQATHMDVKILTREVREAITTLVRNKSAGPDGIAAEFYKEYADMVHLEIACMLNEAHEESTLPHTFLEGEIITPYKKGDPRNVKNYRPITLLNTDYKILTKVLALRLKRYINTVASPQQNGFVPGRSIFDNYHVTQLIQAYIDETDGRGLMIFLDIEKAFDTVSWDYMMRAMRELKVGAKYMRWIEMLYNPHSPPRRRIRTNSEKGDWFEIQSGVAQGCPLSPLLFIFITEAFTRAVLTDEKLRGITIADIHYIISQFADDTVLFLKNWGQLPRMWQLIEEWGDATGLRCNRAKSEGARLGTYKHTSMYTGEGTEGISWVQPGEWIRTLGLPIGEDFSRSDFCYAIYTKVKRKMVVWGRKIARELTIYGRAMMANSFIYSSFRFVAMAMEIPKEILTAIESDVRALIWNREMTFDAEETGTERDRNPLYKEGVELLPRRELGLGLLHWPSHVKALQVRALLNYNDASRGEWKTVLDAWLARLPEGRGAMFTLYPITLLISSNSGRSSYLPTFFRRALFALRELTLTPMRPGEVGCREEAHAEPYWTSLRINTKGVRNVQIWRDDLELNTVGDTMNHEENRPYTAQEQKEGWIDHLPNLNSTGDLIKISRNQWVRKQEVCKQWDTILKRIPPYFITAARSDTERLIGAGISVKAANMMRAMGWKGRGIGKDEEGALYPPETHTPRDGKTGLGATNGRGTGKKMKAREDIAIYEINGVTTYADAGEGIRKTYELDPRGRPVPTGENLGWIPQGGGPHIPLWWGRGIRGRAEFTYPHPKGWTFAELDSNTQLDEVNVRQLTGAFAQRFKVTPTCITTWQNRLSSWHVKARIDWSAYGTLFSIPLITTLDYHLFAKYILHRRIYLRTIIENEAHGTRCRCCGRARETHMHLLRCSSLWYVWKDFRRLVSATWRLTAHSTELIFLGITEQGTLLPPVLRCYHVIMWKMIIIKMTQTEMDGTPFTYKGISYLTARRLQVRMNALTWKQEIASRQARPDRPAPDRLTQWIEPLGKWDGKRVRWANHWLQELTHLGIEMKVSKESRMTGEDVTD